MSTTSPQDPAAPKKPKGPRRPPRENARLAAWILLAVLITLFGVLNVDEVKVHWIVGSGKAPLIIVIVISLLVGILLTYFANRRSGRR